MKNWLVYNFSLCIEEIESRFSPCAYICLLVLGFLAFFYSFLSSIFCAIKFIFCKSSASADDK